MIITVEEDQSQLLINKADSLLNHLDTELGRFSDTGQLHRLNTYRIISRDTELGELVVKSDILVAATRNYFDPTLGSLSLVWGFPQAESVPDSAAVMRALDFTGWNDRVLITDSIITIEENTFMDFGAIAKGHAVDRTYEMLMNLGAIECLVEVGGEVRCGSTTERIWLIGVRHPRLESLAGVLALKSGAVATSGDYECYFIEDAIRYSHLLNWETGYPSRNSAGATVIAEDCAIADAIATAAAVAGPEEVQDFASEMYRGIVLITAEEENYITYEFGEIPWAE